MISIATDLREAARDIFGHALTECSIPRVMLQEVKLVREESGRELLCVGDELIDLAGIKRFGIIAAGKSARPMLESLLHTLRGGTDRDLTGVVISKDQPSNLPPGFRFFGGGHPFPNEASIEGARAALSLARGLAQGADPRDALCLFLLSGGASAMMELPLDPAISLADTVSFHRELVHSGASIAEINCIRKHFSAVKGGRLAMAAGSVPHISLLVSDVPAGHLDALASGPTLPDSSSVKRCREILLERNLLPRFPASVQKFFASPELRETPKPKELRSHTVTLLSADDIANVAKKRAEDLGFHTIIDNTCDDWDYRAAAEYLLKRLRSLRNEHARVCIISAGEIAVEVRSANTRDSRSNPGLTPGVGGRNQHFALYAATLLEVADASILVFSAGTDGIDGNSLAAGAVVDENTLSRERLGTSADGSGAASNLLADAENALRRFDSGTFLESMDARIVTGPTGNNLRDLRILLADRRS